MVIVYLTQWDKDGDAHVSIGYEVDADSMEVQNRVLYLYKDLKLISVWEDWTDAHLLPEFTISNLQGDTLYRETAA